MAAVFGNGGLRIQANAAHAEIFGKHHYRVAFEDDLTSLLPLKVVPVGMVMIALDGIKSATCRPLSRKSEIV